VAKAKSLLCTGKVIAELYERHHETVYRVCFMYMKNTADTEDAVQNTFVNLIKSGSLFHNAEHEKAWLIRTASNICKNNLKHWWRNRENLDDCDILRSEPGFEIDETLNAVMSLPDKYKSVIYLHYYEGYKTSEIAETLHKPQSTIRNLLREARIILKKRIGDFNE
jgi:RNA polymerase sigma-70 factor (ECF subfamily)